MDAFNFIFSLYSILLGLALAEVLGGYGNALQERRKIQIGWLTPLLGLVVALDLTSFWTLAWGVRTTIPSGYTSLMVGLLLCGTYYFAAKLVFPRDLVEWPDFDTYYFEHKKLVIGGVLLCNLVALGLQNVLHNNPLERRLDLIVAILFYPELVALFFVRGNRLNLVLLALLALQYPTFAALYLLGVR